MQQPSLRHKLDELCDALALHFPKTQDTGTPSCAIVAGSGLGMLPDMVENPVIANFADLPHVGGATVVGHHGKLVVGNVENKTVVVLGGRRHPYEGIEVDESSLLLQAVIRHFGLRKVILSNAAGGLNPAFELADIMLIRDHVNFMFRNPLRGPYQTDDGPRFPDMSDAYSARLRQLARAAALRCGIVLREGVYVAGKGPSYETRAEVAMFRHAIGADSVGMSTIHETSAANRAGCEVVAFSVITNLLPPREEITHDEVTTVGKIAGERMVRLIKALLADIEF